MSVVWLVVAIAVVLVAAELFTNSVEWLGKKLDLGEGAVGSILAAVGTALPETVLPIVAIVFGDGEASHEVGIGAILGAPFMLATAAFFVTGASIYFYAARGRRTREVRVNAVILERDVRFFLIVYTLAILSSFIGLHAVKIGVGALLIGLYGYYVWRTLSSEGGSEALESELSPLRFAPNAERPSMVMVLAQIGIALALMVAGSRVFVANVELIAHSLHIPPLVLALVLAPLATELPEKFNSVVWIRSSKDTLALGNITGAMVFQSCIPVTVGLWLTDWVLDLPGLTSAVMALASTLLVYGMLVFQKRLTPGVLCLGGLLYLGFIFYLVWLAGVVPSA
ncbi:MAG: sodium:calcium antiporter [Chloroflexi bacterium]|nr:sodium:calcium antiporter [Chloroflexota bacterium]